jgi:hypothetical protein
MPSCPRWKRSAYRSRSLHISGCLGLSSPDKKLTHADENGGKHCETHELDRFTPPLVDQEHGGIVARDETADSKDDIAD